MTRLTKSQKQEWFNFWDQCQMKIYKATSIEEFRSFKAFDKEREDKFKEKGYCDTGLTKKKDYLAADIPPEKLQAWYDELKPYEKATRLLGDRGPHLYTWHQIKLILLHKNCPKDIREHYASHPIWWKRIPALLCKHVRKENWERAINDPHRFVRKCAYNSCDWLPEKDLLDIVRKDKQAQWDGRVVRWIEHYDYVTAPAEQRTCNLLAAALTDPSSRIRKAAQQFAKDPSLWGEVSFDKWYEWESRGSYL